MHITGEDLNQSPVNKYTTFLVQINYLVNILSDIPNIEKNKPNRISKRNLKYPWIQIISTFKYQVLYYYLKK